MGNRSILRKCSQLARRNQGPSRRCLKQPHARLWSSLLPTIRMPRRSQGLVSLFRRDKPCPQEGVSGCRHRPQILSVIPPGAARGRASAGDKLLDTATMLIYRTSRSRVRALVLVIRHTVAVAVDDASFEVALNKWYKEQPACWECAAISPDARNKGDLIEIGYAVASIADITVDPVIWT